MKKFVIGGLNSLQEKKKAEAILKKMGYLSDEDWNTDFRYKCSFISCYNNHGIYIYQTHDCGEIPITLEELKAISNQEGQKKKLDEAIREKTPKLINLLQKQIGGEIDQFNDGSGMWLELKRGDKVLTFSFDGEGEEIDGVRMYKEIIKVVDREKIF